ncbi:MAG: CoB--CoM heterodisulfide reductase subunit B [Candidatus Hermodarchaeota archaeon]
MANNDLKYALFLGCVIPNRYPFIERATRAVFEKFKIELVDMKGASCCPAPGVFRGFDIETWLVVGARNISIAEELGLDIALMCNGCYGSLLEVNHTLKHDTEKKRKVNEHLAKIGREYKGTVEIRHVVDIMYNDIGPKKITDRTKYARKKPLNLNLAVHYGCHLTKPGEIRPWDNEVENPRFFDELVEISGCKSLNYKDKFLCCGAGGGVRGAFKEISLDYTREKLENMSAAKADAIITSCPFCHLQFDLGQVEVNNIFKDQISAPFNIPVLYFTQLIGLALGMTPEELGLIRSPDLKGVPPFTPVKPILIKLGDTA